MAFLTPTHTKPTDSPPYSILVACVHSARNYELRIASSPGTCGCSTSRSDAISSSGCKTPEWPGEADPLPLTHSCNHFPHSTGFLNYKWDKGYTSLAQNKRESSAAALLLSEFPVRPLWKKKKRARKEKENWISVSLTLRAP